jgi:acetyl coenzyme A synthetase (ADP forming)-like protein
MHTIPPSPAATDELETERLILRDGTTASVRRSTPADVPLLQRFFSDLSLESRWRRFFSLGMPGPQLLERFGDSEDPHKAMTLLALRYVGSDLRVVGVASYFMVTETDADVAFAVDDRFQGKGVATLLLERLAIHASRTGFQAFHASILADNLPMRDVFRDCGYAIRSATAGGVVELRLALSTSGQAVTSADARRHEAATESLRPLLTPKAIAIIGASHEPTKLGSRVLRALQTSGYTGPIYPVHRSAAALSGLPAVRSPRDLAANTDLAIVAVPPQSVPAVVDECAAAKIKALVVITAGFAEIGSSGRAAQDALAAQVRGHGMRMLGPNCMGLLNTDPSVRMNASFAPVTPPAGAIAFSSQSGALGVAVLRLATQRHVGLSSFVSVGNKADVSSNDLLEYWESDPATRVILLYLESFGNPRRFARLAQRIGREKPIIALKAGRSPAGSRAAGSHTAALAAQDSTVDALFRQCGVIRVDTIDEMFDLAVCLDAQALPTGRRVAIVTNAGGPGILAVDACAAAGLEVVEFGASLCSLLKTFLPATASVRNPVDMVASAGPDDYRQAIEAVLDSPEVDALIVVFTPIDPTASERILDGIRDGIAAARGHGVTKPVLACLISESSDSLPLRVSNETIPTYGFPENAARALGRAAAYAAWRTEPAGLFWTFDDLRVEAARRICRNAIERGDTWLNDHEVWDVLAAFGFPVAAHALARTADEAVALASATGYPVAAKLASTRVIHKTDLGAVRLNLRSTDEVRAAFEALMESGEKAVGRPAIDGVLIQPMVSGVVEVLLGVTHDPLFGPLVGFGIGGVNVEAMGDVRFRIAPLTDRDADDVVHEIRGFPLLAGQRGRPRADLTALRDALLRLSCLAEQVPEIAELDLNPVMVLPVGAGCLAIDARIRVAPDASRADPRP